MAPSPRVDGLDRLDRRYGRVEPGIPLRSPDPEWEINANHRRCAESAGVECTVARLEAAPRSVTRTHSGMVIIPRKPSLAGVSYPS